MKKTIAIMLLGAAAATAHADSGFEFWCQTTTAESLVSLAANRIFGPISSLDDAHYKARSQWVKHANELAEQRFQRATGQAFGDVDWHRPSGWIKRCQLADRVR